MSSTSTNNNSIATSPNGLYYIEDFIKSEEETEIMNLLEKTTDWFGVSSTPNSRKVIHYGYEYSYANKYTKPKKINDIPDIYKTNILEKLKDKIPPEIYDRVLKNYNFDQLIINRYEPNQGISMHIDSELHFDSVILCITVGSGTTINFESKDKKNMRSIYVKPRSAYIMSGDARNKWLHGIDKKTYDVVNEKMIKRGTRYSLTFRRIK